MHIQIKKVSKTFGSYRALHDVSIEVPSGELVALLGPSGCGKTTLLRIIAGLESLDAGSIYFNGSDSTKKHVSEKRVGFVFQHYALFRHMTVFENVAFGLRVKPRSVRPAAKVIEEKVRALLSLVQLEGLSQRFPNQLSGGQRQRVALARALAVEPEVLLLDEPFGALDAGVRRELRKWLRHLHDEMKITSLFVTHDQDEALEVADRIVIMNQGRVEQSGTPDEVYSHPGNPFVFNFLGNVNLFHGRIAGGSLRIGDVDLPAPDFASPEIKSALIYVRPHELDLHNSSQTDSFRATIKYVNSAGSSVRLEMVSQWGDPLEVELTQEKYRSLRVNRGDEVHVSMKNKKIFVEDYAI